MSLDKSIPKEGEIRLLPNSPVVYLSIMRTESGIPRGTPIWSSFENKSDERSMENESMASTFLSLSKSISDMADDEQEDGKIIRLNVNNKTYNIYLPNPQDKMQVCFVVVFEETDNILVKNAYKTELVKVITETLRSIDDFQNFLEDEINVFLKKGDPLYDEIYDKIISNIKRWDRKRVKYLQQEIEEKRIREEQSKLEEMNEENDQVAK